MTDDLATFTATLRDQGLHAALTYLNSRTSHRFTGVYRFDGEMLRNVALRDKWSSAVERGDDAPMDATFCAIVGREESLSVGDGREDARYPWMQGNPVVSYCGALIRDEQGRPFGTLCHYDLLSCQARPGDIPLLASAATFIYRAVTASGSGSAPRA